MKPGAKNGSIPWNKGKGKGWLDKRGYRWLRVEENGRFVCRRENRVIMEKHLGRRLEPWELVHHKNGDTADNSISNLEIMTFGGHTQHHHTGSKQAYETRKSLEAFALMRGELERTRELNAELLEACKALVECDTPTEDMGGDWGSTEWCEWVGQAIEQARTAVAKATGATATLAPLKEQL